MYPVSRSVLVTAVGSLALLAGGCATVETKPDFDRTISLITRATGSESVYRPSDDDLITAKIDELLNAGLSADEAVQVCLLNNPTLQASFYRIGMARADVVQSQLLSNPSFAISTRFPSEGGLANLEIGIAQNIVDLWQIPVRRRVAEHQLGKVILEISHQASQLAADAKAAYYEAIAADGLLVLAGKNRETAQRLLELTETLREVGAGSGVDVNLSRSELQAVELSVRGAKLDAFEARSRLARTLGLSLPPSDLVLIDPLPKAPELLVGLDDLLETASANRLDLAAARDAVRAMAASVERERKHVFQVIEVGAEYEREPFDHDYVVGPSISMELPIFDQNQAQIAKAEFAHAEAVKQVRALQLDVAHDVRLAHKRAQMIWETARFYETELLPLRESSLDLAREAYRAGKTPLVTVLEAQRTLREAKVGQVMVLRDIALAWNDLGRVTACPADQLANRTYEHGEQDGAESDPERKDRDSSAGN